MSYPLYTSQQTAGTASKAMYREITKFCGIPGNVGEFYNSQYKEAILYSQTMEKNLRRFFSLLNQEIHPFNEPIVRIDSAYNFIIQKYKFNLFKKITLCVFFLTMFSRF